MVVIVLLFTSFAHGSDDPCVADPCSPRMMRDVVPAECAANGNCDLDEAQGSLDPCVATAPLPPPNCGEVYYLYGKGNPSDIPMGETDVTPPTAPVLINMDPGRDAAPGLVIQRVNTGIGESNPLKHQKWVGMNPPAADLSGNVRMRLWAAMKNFNTSNAGSFTVYLADCHQSGSPCVQLASVTRTRADWDVNNTGSWIEESLDFGPISHVWSSNNRRMSLILVVNGAASDDMWFAYDCTPYPSRIMVADPIPPVITCPANITVNAAPGTCGQVVTYTPPVGTDECPGAATKQIAGLPSGSVFPVGTTTNTFLVLDATDNATTCSFTVTVNDIEAPVISGCPANISVTNNSGPCSATVSWIAPTVNDNCPGSTIVQTAGPVNGGSFPAGVTLVQYTATDASGNTALCSFNVTVVDAFPPTINGCPANIAVNNAAGNCSAVVNWVAPTVTDDCPGAGIAQTQGPVSGSVFPVGVTTVEYTATDAGGNTTVCSFTVTVTDNEVPVIVDCPADISVNNDLGFCGAVVTWVHPTAGDNCPGSSIAQTNGPVPGSTFPIGITTIEYTATDASGNTALCTFTVTVADTELPVITACPADISVNNDLGVCGAVVTWVDPTVGDNCPGSSIAQTAGPVSGSTFPIGITTIEYTATDASGNTAICTFTVTVADNELPVIAACPADISVNNDLGVCGAIVTWVDPTVGDNCPGSSIAQTAGPVSGSTFPIGVTTIEYTATDASGNTALCTFTVTVADTEAPIAVCQEITIHLDEYGNASITAFEVDGGSTDNCGGNTLDLDIDIDHFNAPGTYTVTLTVTDASGNSSTCMATIEVLPFVEIPDLLIPAGFSPNGDGIADTWFIQGLEAYPNNNVVIFNRWGAELFRASPYHNDWDGRGASNAAIGGDLPAGVYFYVLELGDGNNTHTGYIQMNR